jgi:phosphocarrier protein HPr
MIEFTHKIDDKEGLHARPVSKVVEHAKKFDSGITLAVGERSASASELMDVLALDACYGETLTVRVAGPDEKKAAKDMKKVLKDVL